MKIAIVSPYISTSNNMEYYQSQQLNLAMELSKYGIMIDIITAKRSPDEPDTYVINDKVTIYKLPVIARWTDHVLNQLIMVGLWKRLSMNRYDFIQSSDDCILSTLVSAIHVLLKRSRLIIYQGIYEYSRRRTVRLLMKFFNSTAGIILRRACCIAVCKTQRASQFLMNKGFKNTLVVPVGVNTSLFYPVERNKNKVIELLSVGSLIPLKNYPLIVEVLEHLVKNDKKVRLTIIGSGPEKDHILNLVREKELLNNFRLLDKVPNQDMRHYYSQADLLLLLSKTEIFGMVILEAMACGCPVMATPTPGAADVIVDGTNGFLVQDHGPSIASRIQYIIANSSLIESVRSEAARNAREKYAWPVIARHYLNIYGENSCQG